MFMKPGEDWNYPDIKDKKPVKPLTEEQKKNIIKITEETDAAIEAWAVAVNKVIWGQ